MNSVVNEIKGLIRAQQQLTTHRNYQYDSSTCDWPWESPRQGTYCTLQPTKYHTDYHTHIHTQLFFDCDL